MKLLSSPAPARQPAEPPALSPSQPDVSVHTHLLSGESRAEETQPDLLRCTGDGNWSQDKGLGWIWGMISSRASVGLWGCWGQSWLASQGWGRGGEEGNETLGEES